MKEQLADIFQLDVLDTFETIKIAIAYKHNGEVCSPLSTIGLIWRAAQSDSLQELQSYPADLNILDEAEVVYHEMPGWQKPTTDAKSYYDLPKQARDYVEVSQV